MSELDYRVHIRDLENGARECDIAVSNGLEDCFGVTFTFVERDFALGLEGLRDRVFKPARKAVENRYPAFLPTYVQAEAEMIERVFG